MSDNITFTVQDVRAAILALEEKKAPKGKCPECGGPCYILADLMGGRKDEPRGNMPRHQYRRLVKVKAEQDRKVEKAIRTHRRQEGQCEGCGGEHLDPGVMHAAIVAKMKRGRS